MDCGGSLTERAPARQGGDDSGGRTTTVAVTDLERLPTTGSGAVRKRDATRWLESLDEPTPRELRRAVVPRLRGFSGSTCAADVSNVRVTGDPEFVETVAGLFGPLLGTENHRTRLEINLQETETATRASRRATVVAFGTDDTRRRGAVPLSVSTDVQTLLYPLYLQVADRSG